MRRERDDKEAWAQMGHGWEAMPTIFNSKRVGMLAERRTGKKKIEFLEMPIAIKETA